MSLKPLKKSDLGKDWVRNDRYVRKVGIQPEYHLMKNILHASFPKIA